MQVEISEKYYAEAAEWQYQIVTILQEIRKEKGIEAGQAKGIIGDFVFNLAMLHNHVKIKGDGKPNNPQIFFDNLQYPRSPLIKLLICTNMLLVTKVKHSASKTFHKAKQHFALLCWISLRSANVGGVIRGSLNVH